MARSHSSRSRKASLTSFKELAGVDIRVIGPTKVNGSGSRDVGLTREHFLMPDVYKEKVNIPITFEINSDDPDDDIWPTAERAAALPERGVVLLTHQERNGARTIISPVDEMEWNQQTIHDSIRMCKEMGFVQGAVVAPRPLLGSGSDWKVKLPVYWGIITSLNTYIPGQTYKVFAPIQVRWLVPGNHSGYMETKLFPYDLYLIHAALSEEAIVAKMKAQQ